MSNHYELRHTEEREGFTIKLYTTPELDEPDWDFESESAKQKVLEDINEGTLEYFIAKVTAEKAGIELTSDHLGGCCYESLEEFMTPDGYYQAMAGLVIAEANDVIAKLSE